MPVWLSIWIFWFIHLETVWLMKILNKDYMRQDCTTNSNINVFVYFVYKENDEDCWNNMTNELLFATIIMIEKDDKDQMDSYMYIGTEAIEIIGCCCFHVRLAITNSKWKFFSNVWVLTSRRELEWYFCWIFQFINIMHSCKIFDAWFVFDLMCSYQFNFLFLSLWFMIIVYAIK